MENINVNAIVHMLKEIKSELSFCDNNVKKGLGLSAFGLEKHCDIIREIISKYTTFSIRNCDRFKTVDTAKRYFDDNVCFLSNGNGLDCDDCPYNTKDNPHRADCRESWLFASCNNEIEDIV